jgi:hypothetical protein
MDQRLLKITGLTGLSVFVALWTWRIMQGWRQESPPKAEQE